MSDYELAGIRDRLTIAVLDGIWGDTRYGYVGDDLICIGMNEINEAPTSSTNWVMVKYTYSVGKLTRRQIFQGAWDNWESL